MDIFRVLVFDNRSMDSVAREFTTSMRTVGRIRDRVMACIIRDMPEEMILEILGEDKYVKYKDVTLPKWRYKSCLRCGRDDPPRIVGEPVFNEETKKWQGYVTRRIGDLFWNEVEGAWQCSACGAMHLEEVFGDLRLITLIQAGGSNE